MLVVEGERVKGFAEYRYSFYIIRQIGKAIDYFIDAISGGIDNGDRDQRMNDKPQK